ncbi:MAG: glycosyltransferase family 2 protein [Candidatus Magasanikbacteria bacterium]
MFIAIVPAYNEENQIGSVVRSLFDHVDMVVVVDDNSNDNTSVEAEKAGAHVLSHKINRGQGAALQTGHDYALRKGAQYVLHFDGDGQFDALDIVPALECIKKANADILFGSRFLDMRSNTPWFKKKILIPLGRFVDRIFGGLRLTDAHNGFRILHKNALEKIIITQDKMAHASEIPRLVKKHNLSYVEHPVKVTYHRYGQSALGGVRILSDLVVGRFVK